MIYAYPKLSNGDFWVLRVGGNGLGNLLLTWAKLLVASHSTFSMWASFLGRMPVIWYRGKLECRLYTDPPDREIELGHDDPVPELMASMLRE